MLVRVVQGERDLVEHVAASAGASVPRARSRSSSEQPSTYFMTK
jgi:hypothetical protein